jgi:hypothetical protein
MLVGSFGESETTSDILYLVVYDYDDPTLKVSEGAKKSKLEAPQTLRSLSLLLLKKGIAYYLQLSQKQQGKATYNSARSNKVLFLSSSLDSFVIQHPHSGSSSTTT